ncbi:MAG: PE-PPE domain-containing protein [Mycobacterium sp.]
MAGKHRKSARRRSSAARRGGSGLAAAAVSATGLSTALMTGTTTAAAPVAVELVALITPANSTAQFFAGSTYYNNEWTDEDIEEFYGSPQVVPFLAGPQGIASAISDADGEPIAVLASGWGAGQTGTALAQLRDNNDPALNDIDLVILDNNTNRAAGGFWTTYAPFAPLLLTSAEPTPSDLTVPVLDVAYEYNFNSSAPVDPLNPFSIGNTLAAYAFGYGAEQNAPMPQEAIDDAKGEDMDYPAVHRHFVVAPNGTIMSDDPVDGNITYVTFQSDGLPLTRALRLLPGGAILADALDPTLTELVNAGYDDGLGEEGNEAIPLDPTVPRPMQPGSSLAGLGGVPATVETGFEAGADAAEDHVSSPELFVTGPLKEAGKLPFLSTLSNTSTLTNTSSATNRVSTTGGNMVFPGMNRTGTTSSTGGARPLKKIVDNISSSLSRLSGKQDKTDDAASSSPEPEGP